MYRSIFYIGLFVAVMCGMGIISSQSTSYMSVLLPSGNGAVAIFLVALLLIHFSLFEYLRKAHVKNLVKRLGEFLALVAVMGIVLPTYFGLIYYDENPINILMLLLLSVGFIMTSFEPQREATLVKSVKAFKDSEVKKLVNLSQKIQNH